MEVRQEPQEERPASPRCSSVKISSSAGHQRGGGDRGGGGGGQGLETQVQEGGDAGDPPVGPIQSREPKMAAHGHHLLFSSFLGAILGFLRWLSCKASSCQCRRRGFNPWVGKIPCRREWQPTPVFLPEDSHEQRSLEGYSP